jgi:hypothetical protein
VLCATRANSAATCDGTACGIRCNPGFADCDRSEQSGCEVSLFDSVEHCGACGRGCAAPPNATARCAAGACSIQCDVGFELRGAVCERAAIRLLYPQSTAYARDDQPTLRWRDPGGIDSFRVEVDVRRDFATVASEGETATSAASERRVARPLRPSVSYFWRVIGLVEGREVSRSATWFFRVTPRRAAPLREQFHRVVTDINCDGIEDLVLPRGTSEADYGLYVYSMEPLVRAGEPLAPTIIRTSAPARRRVSVSPVGDVDGDGCSDVLASASPDSEIVFGSATGAYEAVRIARPLSLVFRQQLGDLDGDGFAELLLLDQGSAPASPVPYILFGRESRGRIVADRLALRADGISAPVVMGFAVDLDLDGVNELAIRGAPDFTDQAWFRFDHAERRFDRVRDIGHRDIRRVVGDVNGDGYLDYAGGERVELYLGGASGPATEPLALVADSRMLATGFLAEGDLDRDGFDDVVAKLLPTQPPYALSMAVFRGGATTAELLRSDAEFSVTGILHSAAPPSFQYVWRAKHAGGVPYIAVGAISPRSSIALVPLLFSSPPTGSVEPVRVVPAVEGEISVEFFALAPRFLYAPFTPLSSAALLSRRWGWGGNG